MGGEGPEFLIAALAVAFWGWGCGTTPPAAELEPQAPPPLANTEAANPPAHVDSVVTVEARGDAGPEETGTPPLEEEPKGREPAPPGPGPALVASCVGGMSTACDQLAKLTLNVDRQLVEAACRGLCGDELIDCGCARRLELGALVVLDGDERIEVEETLASGKRLTAEGDYALAIKAFGKVLHYNPVDARALAGIGRVHQIRKALAQAEMYTRVALDLTRHDRAAEAALSATLQEIVAARTKPGETRP